MFKTYSAICIALFLLISTAHTALGIKERFRRAGSVTPPSSPVAPSTSSALQREAVASANGISLYSRQPPSHLASASASELPPSIPQNTRRASGPMDMDVDMGMRSATAHSSGASASSTVAPQRRKRRLKDTSGMSKEQRKAREELRAQQRAERAQQAQATRVRHRQREALGEELETVKRDTLEKIKDIQLTPQRLRNWFSGTDENTAKSSMALMIIARKEGVSTDIIREGIGRVKNQSRGTVKTSLGPGQYRSIKNLYGKEKIHFNTRKDGARTIFDRRLFVASIKQGKTPEEALENIIKGRFLERQNMGRQELPQALGLSDTMPSLEEILRDYVFKDGIATSILEKHGDEILEVLSRNAHKGPVPYSAVVEVLKNQYPLKRVAGRTQVQSPLGKTQLSSWFSQKRPQHGQEVVRLGNNTDTLIITIKRERWHMSDLLEYHGSNERHFAPTKFAAVTAPELRDTLRALFADHKVGTQWIAESLQRGGIVKEIHPDTLSHIFRGLGMVQGKRGSVHLQDAAITAWFNNDVGAKGPLKLLEFVRGAGSANHYQKILALPDNLQRPMKKGLIDYGLSTEVVARYATRDSGQQIPMQAVAHWWDMILKAPGARKPISQKNNKTALKLFETPGRDRDWTLAELTNFLTSPLTLKK